MAGKIDRRVLEILKQAEPLALLRHHSRRQWALSVPMEPTQLTAAFNNRAGVSPARMLDLVEKAGAMLGISEPTIERPAFTGTLSKGGWVDAPSFGALPGFILVAEPFQTCRPGDRLLVIPGTFVAKTWVLVRHDDDRLRVHLCMQKGKKRILESDAGEVTHHDDKLHSIVGQVAYRQEPFLGRLK